jgi:hypothetical protein
MQNIIKLCPAELWNKKCSEYTFSHQLVHTFGTIYLWLRYEKISFFDGIDDGINGLSIDNELDIDLTDVMNKLHTKMMYWKYVMEQKVNVKNGLKIKMMISYIYQ